MTGASVLVADDERDIVELVAFVLGRAGYEVDKVEGGDEALRAVRERRPALCILDGRMPQLAGFEVLRRLKEDPATASVPVIVLSNLGQDGDVKRALQGGAHGYLIKANLSLDALVKAVEEATRSRIFQEDLTVALARELAATVKTVGWHSGVRTTCRARGRNV